MSFLSKRYLASVALLGSGVLGCSLLARADMPAYLQHATAASAMEAALFRLMNMSGLKVLYPRPPKESQAELQKLITQNAQQAELYSLKAMQDEQALDFAAAETDWQAYATHAPNTVDAKLSLADYYHRRLRAADEVLLLLEVAAAPSPVEERYIAAPQQRSWIAFTRIIALAANQAMDSAVTQHTYEAWIARYPQENAVYAARFNWLLATGQYDLAAGVIAQYQKAFPAEFIFPVKAAALLALRQGDTGKSIAVYEANFQPLWPQELIDSYFSLLAEVHQERTFLGAAKARLAQNPDDYSALARIYLYQRHAARNDAAQAALDQYRLNKEVRRSAWTADELYTFLTLMQRASAWPEAARYAFALYNVPGSSTIGGRSAQEIGLAAMVEALLTAPGQPITLGARNLSMYRDIATIDQGPGYWNGILSLWMNSDTPSSEFSQEEIKAQPYFHRAKAAELLHLLDTRFPQATSRAPLHARMVSVYAEHGEDSALLQEGQTYLQQFPNGSERVSVATQMADAYARANDTTAEFALYDRLLTELSARTQGMPLKAAKASQSASTPVVASTADTQTGTSEDTPGAVQPEQRRAFEITIASSPVHIDGAAEYSQILERYLGRLVAARQMQPALAVLRKELDRNPNDPLLYERLAHFLEQNDLSAQQEEVYKTAMARFPDKDWYSKLARFYLREKRNTAFADLTREVTRTFEGTDLEAYFKNAGGAGPQMSLQLDLYAAQRFPHDLTFTRNLLELYLQKPTRDIPSRQALLRAHWWEADDLRTEFFESLSRGGTLNAELAQLRSIDIRQNPVAARELAEAEMWRSHFEESAAPLAAFTELYPADEAVGEQAASIFRSLAYLDESQTARAVAIENHLLEANPGNLDRLARIGDIYADAGAIGSSGHEDLAAAEPYWRRMSTLHPGSKDGFLQAATIFWDYFEFDKALEEIQAARRQFNDPALFGYEAGAICEGMRDDRCAVREYAAAALAEDSEARKRLLDLAKRKQFVTLVSDVVASSGNSESARLLREDLLEAQGRTKEIEPVLAAELGNATTLDTVAAIASRAQIHVFTSVYEQALEKEITLAADPVQKIELQYTLAQSKESNKDIAGATRVVHAIYAANPRILGVVRATVDFDWNNQQRPQAIAILREAAAAAQPPLAHALTLEAAAKASENGQINMARDIARPYLDQSPFDPQLLALYAQTYAHASDTAGLRDFYTARLALITTAGLSPDDRKKTTLLLRRGLVPALTTLKDYPGAIEQYILMLSAYPEDEGLASEASLYAMRWQQKDRLIGFVDTTVRQSPKDSRFAAMLAQIQTTFENFPAAVDAWSRAVVLRADKQDWFAAKAELEVRLNRLDEACADYERLYVLSYKNASWMLKVATLRAQQGRKQDAIAALQKAWISGHDATAADEFKIADELETWQMLGESHGFAEQGVKMSGDDMLLSHADGAATYMRVMTRLRQTSTALDVLQKSLAAAKVAPLSPLVVATQVKKTGLASVTDSEWRTRFVRQRNATLEASYHSSLEAMATTVNSFYTPEEKLAFAALIEKSRPAQDLRSIAGAAGLKDMEAQWHRELAMAHTDTSDSQWASYNKLQHSRLLLAEAAHTAKAFALTRKADQRGAILQQAANIYEEAGDEASELQILQSLPQSRSDSTLQARYFALLLKRDSPQLFKLSAANDPLGDAAANYVLAHAEEPYALRALTARGATMEPVWNSTYRAVAGLYFKDTGPATDAAFRSALSDATIAERLAHPADTSRVLTGDLWFSYGMRYAVFRWNGGSGDPEDFAAAELEHNAGFQNYVNIALAYADAGKLEPALAEYRHALELQPGAASLQDAMAVLLCNAGRNTEAIREWQKALTTLRNNVDLQVVPEDFFTTTKLLLRHTHTCGSLPALHSAVQNVLRAYLAKNGTYRSNELLRAAFQNSASPAEGAQWVIALSSTSKDQQQILSDLARMSWMPQQAKISITLKMLDMARMAQKSKPHDTSSSEVVTIQLSLLELYLDAKQDASARALLSEISASDVHSEIIDANLVLASRAGNLNALLDSYAALPESEQPESGILQKAATDLHDPTAARAILEFLFTRRQLHNEVTTTVMLALAEARLNTGDTPGAMELLRRLTLLPSDGNRFANYDLAATLLEKTNHWSQAIDFLQPLAAGLPWATQNTVRLDEARLQANRDIDAARASLLTIASCPANEYALRTRAAVDLRGETKADLGSKELDLLAATAITGEQARQPYFAKARMAAAGLLGSTSHLAAAQGESLLREALAISPDSDDANLIRLGLFHAEVKLGNNQLALAVSGPLLPFAEPSVLERPTAETNTDDNTSDLTDNRQDPADASDTRASAAPITLWSSDKERAQFLSDLADVNWRLQRESEAQRYLRSALRLVADDKLQAVWKKKLFARQSAIRRGQRNDARRPVVRTELQANVVTRPRLLPAREAP